MEVRGSKEMLSGVLLTRVEVLEVEVHIDEVVVVELAVVVTMEEAYFDSLACHDRPKKHFDVSNGLVQTSVDLLEHNSAADYNMEGLMGVVDVRHMRELLEEDVRRVEMVLGSRLDGKGFAHKVMRYSAKRAAAAVTFILTIGIVEAVFVTEI